MALGVFDVVGWAGGGLVAGAYVLVSTRRIAVDTATFQGLNILGAGMLGAASLQQQALPSAGWNLVWVLIGFHSLFAGAVRRGRPAVVAAAVPPIGAFDSLDESRLTDRVSV